MKIVNLEQGMPTVSEAISMLENELRTCKRQNRKCLKLIHGYGSSGKGGKIRVGVRKYLSEQNSIKLYITGENFTIFDENTRKAFISCPELRKDEDLDRYNNGVTFVII